MCRFFLFYKPSKIKVLKNILKKSENIFTFCFVIVKICLPLQYQIRSINNNI